MDDEEGLLELDIYPNPFSSSAHIELKHDKSIELTINVYDLSGKLIDNLFDGRIEDGVSYRFELKSQDGMNSGMYYIRFILDNEDVITKPLILTK